MKDRKSQSEIWIVKTISIYLINITFLCFINGPDKPMAFPVVLEGEMEHHEDSNVSVSFKKLWTSDRLSVY